MVNEVSRHKAAHNALLADIRGKVHLAYNAVSSPSDTEEKGREGRRVLAVVIVILSNEYKVGQMPILHMSLIFDQKSDFNHYP